MKLNLIQRRRLLMLPALLVVALLGNLIVSTSRAAMTVPISAVAAAMTEGGVIGWGSNDYGQVTIPAAAQSGVTAIDAGETHSLALKSNGEVIGWGNNAWGQLTIPLAAKSGVTAIAAGQNHSLALKSNGEVIGWGTDTYPQVGTSVLDIPLAAKSGVVAIDTSALHCLALRLNGQVVAWGENTLDQLNIPFAALSGVTAIAAGRAHSLALKSTGEVIGWGNNGWGQVNIPVEALHGVTAIAAGEFHSLALKNTGEVIGWGSNSSGEITIPDAAKSGVTAIAAGESYSLALKSTGEVIGWGNNSLGQLNIPAAAQSGVTAISVLANHSLALKPLPPNTAPVAVCRNVTVPIVAGCAVSITAAQVDGGSSDPDGDSISLSLDNYGPFGPGDHTVTLTVTDSNGASSSCTANVTVVDNAAPTITLYGANPMTVECPYGFVDPGATATDNCAGTVAVTTSGSVNAGVPGSYTITYSANDGRGNTATRTRTVNVVDTTAPTLTLKPDIQLWPPNHKYQTVTMSQMVQSVVDGCNTSLGIGSVVIEKVTSDEPDDAPGDADGNTTNDILIAADCKSVQLRAERDEKKNGRVYVVTLRVRDASGNTTRKDFKASVPIGQNGVAAVQDATAQTKTSNCP